MQCLFFSGRLPEFCGHSLWESQKSKGPTASPAVAIVGYDFYRPPKKPFAPLIGDILSSAPLIRALQFAVQGGDLDFLLSRATQEYFGPHGGYWGAVASPCVGAFGMTFRLGLGDASGGLGGVLKDPTLAGKTAYPDEDRTV